MARKKSIVLIPTESISVKVDFGSIPEYQRNELAMATVKAAREFFAQPGVEERYQIWLAERNRRLGKI